MAKSEVNGSCLIFNPTTLSSSFTFCPIILKIQLSACSVPGGVVPAPIIYKSQQGEDLSFHLRAQPWSYKFSAHISLPELSYVDKPSYKGVWKCLAWQLKVAKSLSCV